MSCKGCARARAIVYQVFTGRPKPDPEEQVNVIVTKMTECRHGWKTTAVWPSEFPQQVGRSVATHIVNNGCGHLAA